MQLSYCFCLLPFVDTITAAHFKCQENLRKYVNTALWHLHSSVGITLLGNGCTEIVSWCVVCMCIYIYLYAFQI